MTEAAEAETVEGLRAERDALRARLAEAEERLVMAGERLAPAEVTHDPFWARVIGAEVYRPVEPTVSIRHLHTSHAKAAFEASRGTLAADVIVGLCFRNMVTWNSAMRSIKTADRLREQRDAALAELGRPPGDMYPD